MTIGSRSQDAPSMAPLAGTQPPQPAPARRDAVFETDGLTVSYGKAVAVKGVSIDVYRNAITALIGPSGCGKSTVLRCLNRMNDLVPSARVEGDVRYPAIGFYGKHFDPIEVRRRI